MLQVVFYRTPVGGDVVREFIRAQPKADQKVIGEDLKVVQLGFPLGPPLCKSLGSGLWEVRSSLPSKREARLLFFFSSEEQAIVIVNGFIKKTRTTPVDEIRLAEQRRKQFR